MGGKEKEKEKEKQKEKENEEVEEHKAEQTEETEEDWSEEEEKGKEDAKAPPSVQKLSAFLLLGVVWHLRLRQQLGKGPWQHILLSAAIALRRGRASHGEGDMPAWGAALHGGRRGDRYGAPLSVLG